MKHSSVLSLTLSSEKQNHDTPTRNLTCSIRKLCALGCTLFLPQTIHQMNDRIFTYHSSWGHTFECDYCDLRTPIRVRSNRKPTNDKELSFFARDVSEMIAYHAMNIWPQLNGFSGYDTLTFEFSK